MAFLTMNRKKLRENHEFLTKQMADNNIEWAIVTKLLCGTVAFLKEVMSLGNHAYCDSRLSNLATIRGINPNAETIYIKPPAHENVEDVIDYANISFNTEFSTLKQLSDMAVSKGKTHGVIIMIELGDLREGIMGDHLIDFYQKIFQLPNIDVVGLGTNLNCLHGVMPSADKLIQLSLYAQMIELKFGKKLKYISGGTSVVIPLINEKQLPKGINHFRIGETLYYGVDLFEEKKIEGMHDDVFELHSQIIEITKKPMIPIGETAANPSGELFDIDEEKRGLESYRALIDVGLLELDKRYLEPEDLDIEVIGASSDMMAIDLGTNPKNYKTGDYLQFKTPYMGALGLMNSPYIVKNVI